MNAYAGGELALLERAELAEHQVQSQLAAVAAMRESCAKHVGWDTGQCSCGLRWCEVGCPDPAKAWTDHIRAIPLPPDTDDFIQRLVRTTSQLAEYDAHVSVASVLAKMGEKR